MELLIWIVVFLLLSALFSGSEIAFISANKLGIEVRRSSGGRRGRVLASFYDDPKGFISTMLVGNNIALVVFTTLMTTLLSSFFEGWIADGPMLLLINTIIVTIVVLLFGEFLPKTLFRLYSGEFLYNLAYPLVFFSWILKFPTWLMSGISEWFIKTVLRANVDAEDYRISRLDLEQYVSDSVTDEDRSLEKTLFINALNLKQVKVRDCMVPRTEIVAVDVNDTIDDLKDVFLDTRHSRILVYDGELDNIVGYVHHQQLLKKPRTIKRIMMEIPLVTETMSVQDLLSAFMRNNTSLAAVVDEYGGISGLITMEDLQEELFGEIEDEHDQEDYVEVQVSDKEYIFSGRLEIDYLNDKYEHIDFPEGDYHTLSGYIVMTSGAIPAQGSVIHMTPYEFVLELVSDTKIETVRVLVQDPEQAD
jgi:CBS domain containing-hemolysin-like protein